MISNNYSIDNINKMKIISKKYYCNDTVSDYHYFSTILFYVSTMYFLSYTNPIICSIAFIFNILFKARLFMIFHDLCHLNFYKDTQKNIQYAKYIETFCFFIYKDWAYGHNEHHTKHGTIEFGNIIDPASTVFITKKKYNELNIIKKVIFNVIRFPPIFLTILTIYFTYGSLIRFFWLNEHLKYSNIVIYQIKYILFLYIYYLFSNFNTIKLFAISNLITMFLGVILFHLQHAVNIGSLKVINNNNDKINVDINNSSFLKIPNFLKYFTFGIEYHHIHHFSTRIPGYNMKLLHDELNKLNLLKNKQEVGYLQAFKSLFHVYYNEKTNRYESQYIFKIIGLEH